VIVAARDAGEARWLLRAGVDWWDLVRYGPPGFEAYVRVRFGWYGLPGELAEPHLVWPADHAWCLACEVAEEIEFTIGCAAGAAHALAEKLPVGARRVTYGQAAPLYRS
jgi:hypothetical protein